MNHTKFYTLGADVVNMLTVGACAVRMPIYCSCNKQVSVLHKCCNVIYASHSTQQVRIELSKVFHQDLPNLCTALSRCAKALAPSRWCSLCASAAASRKHSHLTMVSYASHNVSRVFYAN